MTALSDPNLSGLSVPTVVSYDEPPAKPPPALIVGPLAWVRNNLFSSWLSTLVSIIALSIAVTVVVAVFNWVVFQASWFIINYNLRLFMVGRYEPDAEWRAQVALIISAAVIGFALATWGRISRTLVAVLAVVVVLSFVIPPVAQQLIPLPPAYVAVGNGEITSGTAAETPTPQIAFIAKAGETVAIQLATDTTSSDETLGNLSGFADNAATLLRGAASNRLTDEARIAEIQAELDENEANGPTLTDVQVERLNDELGDLEIPDPVTETYLLNQAPVHVRLLRVTTGEVLIDAELTPDSDVQRVTLPDDGWYMLERSVPEDSDSTALLRVDGMLPLVQRDSSRSEELDEEGNVVTAGGRSVQFIRLTDGFMTTEARPQIDDKDAPIAITFDFQIRGDHSLPDYIRLYLAPFLDQTNEALLLVLLAASLGYVGAKYFKRRYADQPLKRIGPRIAIRLLTVLPIVIFILIYGVGGPLPLTDTRRWGGLMLTILLTVVGIIGSFPIGVLLALGRRSSLPAVRTFCTVYIETVRGVPLLTVLFMAQLLVPLINPALAAFPNVFRAMVGIVLFSAAYLAENVRGGLQSVPHGQEEAAKALGMSSWQIMRLITLPQALRAVIPALVGQFISLFIDTSLVAIVGLIDLAGISQVVVAQTEFLGLRREAFIFITLIYFSFSYAMGVISRRIETSGVGAARRTA